MFVLLLGMEAAVILPAACSTMSQPSDVAAAEVALTTAERAALVYTTLPSADPAVKAKIKAADNVAYKAVKAAEGGMGTAASAIAAISSLSSIIPAGATP